MTEGTGSIIGGVNRVYKIKEAPHDLTTDGGIFVKAGERVVEAGGKIYAVAEYKSLLANFVEQENTPRSPLNILRNWKIGMPVGMYDPQSGLTRYDRYPNTDAEYRIIQALPQKELDKLVAYLEDEMEYLAYRDFLKWVKRVRAGLLTDGMTDEDRAKAKVEAQKLRDRYDQTHRLMGGWIKLPDGHEVREDGPTVVNMKRLLKSNPQKTFPCPICNKEFDRKALIKVLQNTIEDEIK